MGAQGRVPAPWHGQVVAEESVRTESSADKETAKRIFAMTRRPWACALGLSPALIQSGEKCDGSFFFHMMRPAALGDSAVHTALERSCPQRHGANQARVMLAKKNSVQP